MGKRIRLTMLGDKVTDARVLGREQMTEAEPTMPALQTGTGAYRMGELRQQDRSPELKQSKATRDASHAIREGKLRKAYRIGK